MSKVYDKIFGLQFSNTKCGDPWFYSNALSEGKGNVVTINFDFKLLIIKLKTNLKRILFLFFANY